jgi:hypothetical protein
VYSRPLNLNTFDSRHSISLSFHVRTVLNVFSATSSRSVGFVMNRLLNFAADSYLHGVRSSVSFDSSSISNVI